MKKRMSDDGGKEWVEWYHHPHEIERLVAAFLDCSLPQKEWTHFAHLTVGLWHCLHYGPSEAILRTRFGIQTYNESCGVKMTPQGGYHETITLFYVWAIGRYLDSTGRDKPLVGLANGLLNGPLGDRQFPLEYYSRERLFSWEARIGWVEPDLKPLEGAPQCTPPPF
jgi:hypothetical protein